MTRQESPNRELLEAVARRLGPLLTEVVFVGGQVAELVITDPAAVRIRPTTDVDAVIDVTTRARLAALEERMRALGFRNDMAPGAPICRWNSPDGHVLDLMPADAKILGFSNRWYAHALARPLEYELLEGLRIRIPTAPVFVATKLEAFRGRGDEDLLRSHDLEDVISVVAGRPELTGELEAEPSDLRQWLRDSVAELLDHKDFSYAVQGALPDASTMLEYLAAVRRRFELLASPPRT